MCVHVRACVFGCQFTDIVCLCMCVVMSTLTLYVCVSLAVSALALYGVCLSVLGFQCTDTVCVCVCVCVWLSMHSDRHCERQAHALSRLLSVVNPLRMALLQMKSCSIHSCMLPTFCLVLNAP